MRNFVIGILCGAVACLLVVPASTQQTDKIVVGTVPLEIGMAKEAVMSRIAEAGLNLAQGENENWLVTEKNDRILGTLNFANSRLSWASHRWTTSSDAGAAKLGRSLYFVLKSFEDQGNTSCAIETKNLENPDWDNKSIVIHCGKRTAVLAVSTLKDQRPQASLDEVIK